jgi:hypothetical protein
MTRSTTGSSCAIAARRKATSSRAKRAADWPHSQRDRRLHADTRDIRRIRFDLRTSYRMAWIDTA